MPFVLIKGTFHPKAGLPDGDSVRFKADDDAHWKKLEGRPVKPGAGAKSKGTVQLRFEGIDAIEKAATKPLSTEAKENMFRLIGYDENSNPTPSGYILTRMTDDKSRRPIAFVFAGSAPEADGKENVHLGGARLRRSVNYRQMEAGFAYPLYYNTLFHDLRNQFDVALKSARTAKRKYWKVDATRKGVRVRRKEDLATIPPIWPKLWRRLEEHLRTTTGLAGFKAMLEKKNERVDLLSVMHEVGLQDVVRVSGNKVWLSEAPENIRVRGKAGARK
jgi:endonuclease YncB( thermonuclease family)